jgi:hypothetical protein
LNSPGKTGHRKHGGSTRLTRFGHRRESQQSLFQPPIVALV